MHGCNSKSKIDFNDLGLTSGCIYCLGSLFITVLTIFKEKLNSIFLLSLILCNWYMHHSVYGVVHQYFFLILSVLLHLNRVSTVMYGSVSFLHYFDRRFLCYFLFLDIALKHWKSLIYVQFSIYLWSNLRTLTFILC